MLLLSGVTLLASMFGRAPINFIEQKGVKIRITGACAVDPEGARQGIPGIKVRAYSKTAKRFDEWLCGETTTGADGSFSMDAWCEERGGLLNRRQKSSVVVKCEMSSQFIEMGWGNRAKDADCPTIGGESNRFAWTAQKKHDTGRIYLRDLKPVRLFLEAEKVGRALVAAGVGPRPRHTICVEHKGEDGPTTVESFASTTSFNNVGARVLWKEPDMARFVFAKLYGMSLLRSTRPSWAHTRALSLGLPTDVWVPTETERLPVGELQHYAYSAGWGYFIAALGGVDKLQCNQLTTEAGATEAERIADTRNVGCRYWRLYRKWGYAPIWNALPTTQEGAYQVSFETFMAKYEKTRRTARAVATGQAR